jgi:hypothetical protein
MLVSEKGKQIRRAESRSSAQVSGLMAFAVMLCQSSIALPINVHAADLAFEVASVKRSTATNGGQHFGPRESA